MTELEREISKLSLDELMKFDGLAEAEKLTGRSYKENKETETLGMTMTMIAGALKRKRLAEMSDTQHSTTIPEFHDMLISEGFERIYYKEYTEKESYKYQRDEDLEGMLTIIDFDRTSCFFVYWNDELKAMVYGTSYPHYSVDDNRNVVKDEETINSASLKYTVKLKDGVDERIARDVLSSSNADTRSDTIIGDHDIRDGFRMKLNNLKKYWNFVNWEGNQHLWLLHYMQHRSGQSYDSAAINKEVIAEFPDNVKEAIGNKYYGAPMTLHDIGEHLVHAYFGWNGKEQLTYQEQDEWFEDTFKPGMSDMWFENEILKKAHNKEALRKWYRKFKAFNDGQEVTS